MLLRRRDSESSIYFFPRNAFGFLCCLVYVVMFDYKLLWTCSGLGSRVTWMTDISGVGVYPPFLLLLLRLSISLSPSVTSRYLARYLRRDRALSTQLLASILHFISNFASSINVDSIFQFDTLRTVCSMWKSTPLRCGDCARQGIDYLYICSTKHQKAVRDGFRSSLLSDDVHKADTKCMLCRFGSCIRRFAGKDRIHFCFQVYRIEI